MDLRTNDRLSQLASYLTIYTHYTHFIILYHTLKYILVTKLWYNLKHYTVLDNLSIGLSLIENTHNDGINIGGENQEAGRNDVAGGK